MDKFEYFDNFYKYLYLAKVYGLDNVYKVGVTRKYKKRIKNLLEDSPHGFEFILVFTGNAVYTKEQDMLHLFPSHKFINSFSGHTEYILIDDVTFKEITSNELEGFSRCYEWRP